MLFSSRPRSSDARRLRIPRASSFPRGVIFTSRSGRAAPSTFAHARDAVASSNGAAWTVRDARRRVVRVRARTTLASRVDARCERVSKERAERKSLDSPASRLALERYGGECTRHHCLRHSRPSARGADGPVSSSEEEHARCIGEDFDRFGVACACSIIARSELLDVSSFSCYFYRRIRSDCVAVSMNYRLPSSRGSGDPLERKLRAR